MGEKCARCMHDIAYTLSDIRSADRAVYERRWDDAERNLEWIEHYYIPEIRKCIGRQKYFEDSFSNLKEKVEKKEVSESYHLFSSVRKSLDDAMVSLAEFCQLEE